jgi:hypothetical protein
MKLSGVLLFMSIAILLVFAILGALGGFACNATGSFIGDASGTVVALYSDADFKGNVTYLTVGDFDLSDLQTLGMTNDSTSSIKVKNGYTAFMYKHFKFNTSLGDTGGWINTVNDNIDLLSGDFNNNMSSIKIYPSKIAPTPTPTIAPTPTPVPTVTPTPPVPTLPPTGGGGTNYTVSDTSFLFYILLLVVLFSIFVLAIKGKKV